MRLVITVVLLVLLFEGGAANLEKPTVSPSICYSVTSFRIALSPEKCDGIHDTGSDISQVERNMIPVFINEYRAYVNNNCTLGLGIPKPVSNYRKVKYSCALEMESKFECINVEPKTFKSDNQTYRYTESKHLPEKRTAIFGRSTPRNWDLMLNPNTQTVKGYAALFMKFFMSEDVTKVGCFVKQCGRDEYMACKTNHDHTLPKDAPLYILSHRCNVDADCTRPGYRTCDASVGLCDYMSQDERKAEVYPYTCEDMRNVYVQRLRQKCGPEYDTGSEIGTNEREIIVQFVNHYRQLINNNCSFGKGSVKPVTNYRKVKYSCALEEDAKFECADITSENFKSDEYTLRNSTFARGRYRTAIFVTLAPSKNDMLIDPNNQTIGATDSVMNFTKLMLSPEVTAVGCFVRVCNESEYIACTTGQPIMASRNEPLYKPGSRCMVNEDCTFPGYGICDDKTGLCELGVTVPSEQALKRESSHIVTNSSPMFIPDDLPVLVFPNSSETTLEFSSQSLRAGNCSCPSQGQRQTFPWLNVFLTVVTLTVYI